jgi:hypothetical protein
MVTGSTLSARHRGRYEVDRAAFPTIPTISALEAGLFIGGASSNHTRFFDRILRRPELLRGGLIDDDHALPVFSITRCQAASAHDRYAEDLEVSRSNIMPGDDRGGRGVFPRSAHNLQRSVCALHGEWSTAVYRSPQDTRYAADLP